MTRLVEHAAPSWPTARLTNWRWWCCQQWQRWEQTLQMQQRRWQILSGHRHKFHRRWWQLSHPWHLSAPPFSTQAFLKIGTTATPMGGTSTTPTPAPPVHNQMNITYDPPPGPTLWEVTTRNYTKLTPKCHWPMPSGCTPSPSPHQLHTLFLNAISYNGH